MTSYQLRIQAAVALSLLLHALAFGLFQLRDTALRVWNSRPHAGRTRVAQAVPTRAELVPTITFVEQPRRVKETKPQIFIETDDRQKTTEKPGPTPYYSNKATVAANPDNPTGITGETPYLEGQETRLLSTEDVPVPTPGAMALSQQRMQQARETAARPPAPPPPPPQPEPPKNLADQGLAPVKPLERPPPPLTMLQPARPGAAAGAAESIPAPEPGRTGISFPGRDIAARKTQLKASGLTRRGVAAFNVAESPFGDYDRRLIRAVQQRWYALIERHGVYERAGTVTLYFQLYDDGSIRNLSRKENTAGEILALYCEKAVADAAPFEALTDDLRRLVGSEPREVNFTFYY